VIVTDNIQRDAVFEAPPEVDSSTESAGSQRTGSFRYFVDGDRWVFSEDVAMMHGYRQSAFRPGPQLLLQHTHFEDRARISADLRRLVLGQALSTRYRIVDSVGKLHWIVLIADQMKDESGAVVGAAGHFIDVTEAVRVGVTAAVSEFATSRALIEQAKGVLMVAYGGSADDAFATLVQRSQHANVKVKDIATQLVSAITEGSARLRIRVDDVLRTVAAQTARERTKSSAYRAPTSVSDRRDQQS
jgi:hypothetical protein